MKTSSAKAKGRRCRRCKQIFEPDGARAICPSCRSQCSTCGVILTPENMDKTGAKRNQYRCKSCVPFSVKRSRGNKGFCQESYDLERHYGITKEERDELFKNGCELCGAYDKLCVDHVHTTGAVRGCLCHRCNIGIGMLNDDTRILEEAIRYLNRSKEK